MSREVHVRFCEQRRGKFPPLTLLIVHCRSLEEAEQLRRTIDGRMRECRLELHPEKTKIVYCKDSNRPGGHENEKFDFLGFTFRPR